MVKLHFLSFMVVAAFSCKFLLKWISLQVMYAYYHDCDPMTTRQVNKKDQLFPLFVMQVKNIFSSPSWLLTSG